jgi:hypothetical protein
MMSVIWLLACPLGMLAIGGVAWVAGRLPGERARGARGAAGRVTCMPSGSSKPAEGGEDATAQELSHV